MKIIKNHTANCYTAKQGHIFATEDSHILAIKKCMHKMHERKAIYINCKCNICGWSIL